MKQKWLLLILLMFGLSFNMSAQQIGRWEKLGERSVKFRTERDVIKCSHKGTFSKLKIRVNEAPVEFNKVLVRYGNGSTQELYIRQTILAGGYTRVLDLRGNKRVIKEIVFYYKTKKGYRFPSKNHRAVVSVWGRH